MRVLYKFCAKKIRKIIRSIYWLYRLSKSNLGKNVDINFPFKIEGTGELITKDNVRFDDHVHFGLAMESKFEIGENSNFERFSKVIINKGFSVTVGNDFLLGEYSKLFVHSNWVIGNDVKIQCSCSIFSREDKGQGVLTVGDGSRIGDFTIIDLVNDVTIENEVAIGPNCTLYTHDHIYSDISVPAWKGGLKSEPIIIKPKAWVGSNVTILPGVTIGEHAVVAAGAIVTKDVAAYTIVGGIPAKQISKIDI